MNQHPKFFAAQIEDADQLRNFWILVNLWGFSGETAFCKVVIDRCGDVGAPA